MRNDKLNVTELMTGKDGELHCIVDQTDYFLAEINQFATNMNVNSTDVQPVGSMLVYGVPTGVTFDLTFTEMIVRDDVIMKPILDGISKGVIPTFDFRGKMTKPDGTSQTITYNDCYPNGTFGLQNLQPGEVVTGERSFRINSFPKYIASLASSYLGGTSGTEDKTGTTV